MHCVSTRYKFWVLKRVVQIVNTRPERENIIVPTDCYGYWRCCGILYVTVVVIT